MHIAKMDKLAQSELMHIVKIDKNLLQKLAAQKKLMHQKKLDAKKS